MSKSTTVQISKLSWQMLQKYISRKTSGQTILKFTLSNFHFHFQTFTFPGKDLAKQFWSFHLHTFIFTLSLSHFYFHTFAFTGKDLARQFWNLHFHISTSTLSLPHIHFHTFTFPGKDLAGQFWNFHCHTFTSTLSLPHIQFHTFTFPWKDLAGQFWNFHFHTFTFTFTPLLSHFHFSRERSGRRHRSRSQWRSSWCWEATLLDFRWHLRPPEKRNWQLNKYYQASVQRIEVDKL